jgi:hypothetical protein
MKRFLEIGFQSFYEKILQIFLKNQAQKVIENFRKKEKSRKKF